MPEDVTVTSPVTDCACIPLLALPGREGNGGDGRSRIIHGDVAAESISYRDCSSHRLEVDRDVFRKIDGQVAGWGRK